MGRDRCSVFFNRNFDSQLVPVPGCREPLPFPMLGWTRRQDAARHHGSLWCGIYIIGVFGSGENQGVLTPAVFSPRPTQELQVFKMW